MTANTRADGEEFLAIAAQIPVKVVTTPYAFAEADEALADLAHDRVNGAAVLHASRPRPRCRPARDGAVMTFGSGSGTAPVLGS